MVELAAAGSTCSKAPRDQQRGGALGRVRIGDEMLAVDHGDRAATHCLELRAVPDHRRRVLVDPQALPPRLGSARVWLPEPADRGSERLAGPSAYPAELARPPVGLER